MEVLQNRIDSFAKTKTKRVKTGQKSRTVTLKWPHPPTFLANPAALAEAGFYYSPSVEDKDDVTCFECGKQLSEWEEQDDPFDIHWSKCADQCSWAAVRCGLRVDLDRHGRFTFPGKSRLPGTKRMEEARLGTFTAGDGWVHDQVKNHGASSRKMAQAGFVWTPQHPGDDLATCFYCNIALSGWEKDDDPMEEHRRRGKPGETCPFLSYIAESEHASKLTRSTSKKPPSRTQSKMAAAPSQSRASKPTRARTMSSRRMKVDTENDDDEDLQLQNAASEDEDDTPPAPSQFTRSTSVKPLSRNQSKMAAPPSKSRASKISKSQVASSRGKKSEVVADVAASSTTRRKTRKVVDEEITDTVDDEDAQLPSQPASEEENELDPQAQLTQSTSMKPPSRTHSKTEAARPRSRTSRARKREAAAAGTDRRKTPNVASEDIMKDEDTQPASEDVQLLSRRAPKQENTTQLVFAKRPSGACSEIEATPLQSQASETAKTEVPSAPSTSQCKSHDEPLDDVHTGQVPVEEKKTSILQKTPPPAELFSLNFDSTPKQGLPMPITAPQKLALPTSEALLQGLPPIVSNEVAPKPKTPEPQILPSLSRIPFMPLQTLTDAELDMTVEEWIRYQMEVEFDKLKRDGEREMARFKARAEEVRKMIENL